MSSTVGCVDVAASILGLVDPQSSVSLMSNVVFKAMPYQATFRPPLPAFVFWEVRLAGRGAQPRRLVPITKLLRLTSGGDAAASIWLEPRFICQLILTHHDDLFTVSLGAECRCIHIASVPAVVGGGRPNVTLFI